MLAPLIRDWLSGIDLGQENSYLLWYKELTSNKNPLSGKVRARVLVYVHLKSGDIPFTDMAQSLQAALGGTDNKVSRIDCTWIISSPSGGIYLYEALAVPAHAKCGKTRNRFIVINSLDGTVSLGPGHPLNTSLTRRLNAFVNEARSIPASQRLAFFAPIMGAIINSREQTR